MKTEESQQKKKELRESEIRTKDTKKTEGTNKRHLSPGAREERGRTPCHVARESGMRSRKLIPTGGGGGQRTHTKMATFVVFFPFRTASSFHKPQSRSILPPPPSTHIQKNTIARILSGSEKKSRPFFFWHSGCMNS